MKFDTRLSIQQLVRLLSEKVRIVGNPDFLVSGMNEIHMLEDNELTFVDHPKYYEKALNSKADVLIINKEVECPEGKHLIISEDPLKCMNELTRHFRPFLPSYKAISDTAVIGEGTHIQPNVFIGNHVKIGKNCLIHANVSIYDYTEIGDNVIIQANSVIGGDACYFPRKGNEIRKFESSGRTIIGNDVEIGALCAIDRGVTGDTIIGDGCKFDNFVQIGHDTHIGKYCLLGSHSAIAGVTVLEDNVMIWGNVMVNKDLTVGKGAVILATSAVDKTLEGGKVYFGVPAIEAGKKWRELACLKNLPDIVAKLPKDR